MKKTILSLALAVLTLGLLDSCKKEETPVAVKSVSLDKQTLSIVVGAEDVQLVATVLPENAANKKVGWTSNKAEIATVDNEGKVHAVAAGEAIITVTTEDGGKKATCTVTVTTATVAVESVSLDKETLELVVGGEDVTLVATVTPENATNKKVSWGSDHTDIATVDENGKVHAVAPGEATITVTTEDGSKKANCTVTVTTSTVAVESVSLDKETLELYVNGKDVVLIATVLPEDADDKSVSWSSDKPETATVDSTGKVQAVAAGEATITVTTEDGGKNATCTVTVKEEIGTESKPVLISSAADLAGLKDLLKPSLVTYVKLEADIDMAAIEGWVPLNLGSDRSKDGKTQYANEINFDGGGKTIKNFSCKDQSYASFFGVLVGECRDLTFESAEITQETGDNSCGVVGGYVGTGSRGGILKNVTLKGCKVKFATADKNPNIGLVAGNSSSATFENVYVNSDCTLDYSTHTGIVGGIVGNAQNGTVITQCANEADITATAASKVAGIAGQIAGNVYECYNTGNISAKQDVAGIVGCILSSGATNDNRWEIRNCYNTGNLTYRDQKAGGISAHVCQFVNIIDCYNTGDVEAEGTEARCAGGIAGQVCGDAWKATETDYGIRYAATNDIISCHTYCSKITSLSARTDWPAAGAIAAYTSIYDTYKGCYRAPVFGNNKSDQTALSAANEPNLLPVDQADSDKDHPITEGIKGTTSAKGEITASLIYPYHGKVAAQEKLTDLIGSLTGDIAWDTTIWDLSGNRPTLKNNPEK